MPLQMQPTAFLPGQENLVHHQQSQSQQLRTNKTVSFQTPAAAGKKSKSTTRRAFGDISNKKQPLQQSASHPQKPGVVTKPSQSKVRLELKPSTSAAKAKTVSTTKSKSSQKAKRQVYDSPERPYGLTGKELDELYDSDDHISVCSMEKEGFLFSRSEASSMIRQAMDRRRQEEQAYFESLLKDERAELARIDGEYIFRKKLTRQKPKPTPRLTKYFD